VKLGIIAIGHKLPEWAEAATKDYAQRFGGDITLEIKALKAEPRTTGLTTEQIKFREAERIRAAMPRGALLAVLDERGKAHTTQQLATQLQRWRDQSAAPWFVIGGADGLDEALKTQAAYSIRLSDMTLPHALARVLLAEQLYRAVSLLQGHPYHRE
jgi:23S rRNA (pseudouridine1915-N3)-methyltransferase